jgi:hypothetical protein
MDKITKHYNESKSKYDVEGESHLKYYKEKYPENYNLLKQNYERNVIRTIYRSNSICSKVP